MLILNISSHRSEDNNKIPSAHQSYPPGSAHDSEFHPEKRRKIKNFHNPCKIRLCSVASGVRRAYIIMLPVPVLVVMIHNHSSSSTINRNAYYVQCTFVIRLFSAKILVPKLFAFHKLYQCTCYSISLEC